MQICFANADTEKLLILLQIQLFLSKNENVRHKIKCKTGFDPKYLPNRSSLVSKCIYKKITNFIANSPACFKKRKVFTTKERFQIQFYPKYFTSGGRLIILLFFVNFPNAINNFIEKLMFSLKFLRFESVFVSKLIIQYNKN